jgi:glycosyltransferase involved in cell wall biosynthesis
LNSARRPIQARLQAIGLLSEAVFVSRDCQRAALECGAVRPQRVSVVHNGIDPDRQTPSAPRAAVRDSLGIADHEIVVGTMSRISPVKRHVDLLDAHLRLRDAGVVARCLIVGGGEPLTMLRDYARALGIESSVIFAGWRSDVPDVLSAMDVFVLPSESEGLAVTLLEAMAQGLPVVASNVGGNPEVVADGESGLLVPPLDPPALASAIALLVQDAPRRAAMGAAGRRRLRGQFSQAAMVASYRNIYNRLCA